MSSDSQKHAADIIAVIMVKLNGDNIGGLIDKPIDRAAEQFSYKANYPVLYKQFHYIIADFLRHIHKHGLKSPWQLSDPLARAISLLEIYYEGTCACGYSAAVLDVKHFEQEGFESVLSQLAEAVKTSEREKYTKAIFAMYLGSDWPLRCEIARILLKRCQMLLPIQMRDCTPEQVVDYIPSLISTYINSFAVLQQISSNRQK